MPRQRHRRSSPPKRAVGGTTWDGGKSDREQILAAAEIVREFIPSKCRLWVEPYLHVEYGPEDEEPTFTIEEGDAVDKGDLAGGVQGLERFCSVRHPDLLVADPKGVPRLIIEIDGAYHDSLRGRRADDRRARDYKEWRIPLLAVRLSEYPGDDEAWQEALREMLKAKVWQEGANGWWRPYMGPHLGR